MKIGILGAGSWGLTLSWLWSKERDPSERKVWLWDRKPEKIQAFKNNRAVDFPVEVELPEQLILVDQLEQELKNTDVLVLAVTADGTRKVCQQLFEKGLPKTTIIVNASKGLEDGSLKRLSQVIHEELPFNPQAVLAGPTLAKEMLAGLPTAASIACEDLDLADKLRELLSQGHHFRLYSHPDVIGAELGGAIKNVIAIASGYIASKKLGDNARAALMTRGLAEMTRFGMALGAQEVTLYGLSGLGDLLATSNSPLSRNYQVGYQLAQGKTLDDILQSLKVVAEGVPTAQVVKKLAEKLELDMPIVQEINRALFESPSEELIVRSLMSRKLKSEKTTSFV